MIRFIFFQVCLLLYGNALYAQNSLRFTHAESILVQSRDAFYDARYQDAYQLAGQFLHHYHQEDRNRFAHGDEEARYIRLGSALMLSKPLAEKQLSEFAEQSSRDDLKQRAHSLLAHYYYQRQQFDLALKHFEQGDIRQLSNEELRHRNFEMGYSYLVGGQMDKVGPYFQSAKSISDENYASGNYYHGLLAYHNNDMDEARKSFAIAARDKRFSDIVPLYLFDLDYRSGKGDSVLPHLQQWIMNHENPDLEYQAHYLLAQIYLDRQQHAEALPSLELNAIRHPETHNIVRVAYALSQTGRPSQVIETLNTLSPADTQLSDLRNQMLFSAHLQLKQWHNAYLLIEKMHTGKTETERSLLWPRIQLAYLTGDSVKALQWGQFYAADAPEPDHKNTLRLLLAELLTAQGRIPEGLQYMRSIPDLSSELQQIYGRLLWWYAMEQIKNKQFEQGFETLQECKNYPLTLNQQDQLPIWQAECQYHLGRYEQSLMHVQQFFSESDTLQMNMWMKPVQWLATFCYTALQDTIQASRYYRMASADTLSGQEMLRIPGEKPIIQPEASELPVWTPQNLVPEYRLPPFVFAYQPAPFRAIALETNPRQTKFQNYAWLQAGNLKSLGAGLGLQLKHLTDFPLYLEANRFSQVGKLPDQAWAQSMVGLQSELQVKTYQVDLRAAWERQAFSYFGRELSIYGLPLEDTRQTYHRLGIQAFVQPLRLNEKVKHHVNIYTGFYMDRQAHGEYSVRLDAPISMAIKSDLHINSDILMDVQVYFTPDRKTQFNHQFSWRPSVRKQIMGATLKAGVYPTVAQQIHLLPDVSISYPIHSRLALLEVGWQRHLRLNTLEQLSTENPFLMNSFRFKQSLFSDLFVKLEGSVLPGLSYQVQSGWRVVNHLPLFIQDTLSDTRQFRLLFEERASIFFSKLSIQYAMHQYLQGGLRLLAQPVISQRSQIQAWHYIPLHMQVWGKYRLRNSWWLQAQIFAQAGARVPQRGVQDAFITLKPVADLNLDIKYQMTANWQLTASLNNLLGANYQRWYQYPQLGRQMMLGACRKFELP